MCHVSVATFSAATPLGINGAAMMVPAADDMPVIAYDNANTNDLKVVNCSNSGSANP